MGRAGREIGLLVVKQNVAWLPKYLLAAVVFGVIFRWMPVGETDTELDRLGSYVVVSLVCLIVGHSLPEIKSSSPPGDTPENADEDGYEEPES